MNSPEDAKGFLDARELLPFEELFIPVVLGARATLRCDVGARIYGLLTPMAHAGWERYLLGRLTRVGARAAHWQFQIFKTVKQVFPKAGSETGSGSNFLYCAFIGDPSKNRLERLYKEFPSLAQLCRTLVKNWVVTVAEFLARLNADRNDLSDRLRVPPCVFPISLLQAGLSDPHRGGRCVVKMNFENGASIVYKPRTLAPEAHFSVLLDNLNATSIPHLFRVVHCWDRGEYGWMENIDCRPCDTRAQIHAYYWRAGALLGLVHLAYGIDFHQENVIACGDNPVIVDLEALWHPNIFADAGLDTAFNSVLWTGFLPLGDPQKGAFFKWSALSSHLQEEKPTQGWIHINQDEMAMELGQPKIRDQHHLPVLSGAVCMASGYVPDVLTGFRWIGEQLLGSSEAKATFKLWLYRLTKCPRRLILQPTLHYQIVLEQSIMTRSLRGERTPVVQLPHAVQTGEISREELKALEQFDVPYFVQTDHGNIPMRDLANWNPSTEDYLAQLSVIEKSLS